MPLGFGPSSPALPFVVWFGSATATATVEIEQGGVSLGTFVITPGANTW
jgi:hypothetical protein